MAHQHHHGVMTGWIVRPYDLVIGGLAMRGTYRQIAAGLTVGVAPGARLLDVGTGPGRLLVALSARRPDLRLTGLDPSADMIARARQRTAGLPSVDLVVAPAEDIPLPDESVDVVVSSLSSHHWEDPGVALAEQARVLGPGGRFWLIDMTRYLDDERSDQMSDAGLQLDDGDLGLGGPAGRRMTVLAAHKPLAAA